MFVPALKCENQVALKLVPSVNSLAHSLLLRGTAGPLIAAWVERICISRCVETWRSLSEPGSVPRKSKAEPLVGESWVC